MAGLWCKIYVFASSGGADDLDHLQRDAESPRASRFVLAKLRKVAPQGYVQNVMALRQPPIPIKIDHRTPAVA